MPCSCMEVHGRAWAALTFSIHIIDIDKSRPRLINDPRPGQSNPSLGVFINRGREIDITHVR